MRGLKKILSHFLFRFLFQTEFLSFHFYSLKIYSFTDIEPNSKKSLPATNNIFTISYLFDIFLFYFSIPNPPEELKIILNVMENYETRVIFEFKIYSQKKDISIRKGLKINIHERKVFMVLVSSRCENKRIIFPKQKFQCRNFCGRTNES